MPKETITSARNAASPTYIRVGWSRESGHVQLATANPDGRLALVDQHGNAQPVDTIEDHGWFVDMDRQSLNDLIRLLRRARDAAFGADA